MLDKASSDKALSDELPTESRLKVVLCWHMHQPEYRDLRTGQYQLPWTYLHVIKDYVDMAGHLEAQPEARAVVNFAPVLLSQIDDYAGQIERYLKSGESLQDPLLAALVGPVLPVQAEERLGLIKACLRANEERLIKRFPAYQRLAQLAKWLMEHPGGLTYTTEQLLVDLLVWHHLAWMGDTVRRSDSRLKFLTDKQSAYTHHDRRELLQVIGEQLSTVIGRYRSLAEKGQIELSLTPYAHPIMPLLLDLASASEAMPGIELPIIAGYPDGEARVRWHLQKGVEIFERYFGFKPLGCWPSEGSISDRTLELMSEFGFDWAASGGTVLRNSLDGLKGDDDRVHRPYRLQATDLACFFRDDGLSDMIGFTYADWHADDAVANLLHHLTNIAESCEGHPESVVSIILDGENAWEYYPENGYHFLSALYKGLTHHPKLELTTFSDYLAGEWELASLPRVVAGSWVHGSFSTWIGDKDKNRGWDMLSEVKHLFDQVVASGQLDAERLALAEQQLAVCEGSDWFWWFGDYNPAASVSDFEHLYRLHLANLYQLIGRDPPPYLSEAFTHGGGAPAVGGVMRPGQETS